MVVVETVAMVQIKHTGMSHPDDGSKDINVDIVVEGADEDEAEKVAMHLKDQCIRALNAFEEEKPPEECDGHFMTPAWGQIFEEDD